MKLFVQNLNAMPDCESVIAEIASISSCLDFHFLEAVKREYSELVFINSFSEFRLGDEGGRYTQGAVMYSGPALGFGCIGLPCLQSKASGSFQLQ